MTAHHPADLPANLDRRSQLDVWVPFHFIPGGRGPDLGTKLVCAKDGPIANAAVARSLRTAARMEGADRDVGLMLIGVALHAYWDTFSHYGFSGVSSKWNRIDIDSLRILSDGRDAPAPKSEIARFDAKHGQSTGRVRGLRKWWRILLDGFASDAVEMLSGALGHGAALTYPDKPWLRWSFDWEERRPWAGELEARTSLRDNSVTCAQACRGVEGIAWMAHPADRSKARRLDDQILQWAIGIKGPKEHRMDMWRKGARDSLGIEVPDYEMGAFGLSDRSGWAKFASAAGCFRDIVRDCCGSVGVDLRR